MDTLIKNIIERIKLWWNNLFKKKKKITKTKKQLIFDKDNNIKKKNKYVFNINLEDENKTSTIGTFYPKLNANNKFLLKKKADKLKKKIINLNIKENNINEKARGLAQPKENELNIKIIDNIIEKVNDNEIYINQAIEINNLLNTINNDQELNLNTNEKLNILKDNISTIIDKKLDDYETSIIKKAYQEFDNVNYIIVTTLLIDDIIDEINELNEDFKKNKYTKIEYERKIKKIKEKIDKLENINNRKEVQDEIENLKKDFYTKKKDKYDLLYNNEIFINLNNKCDELLEIINNKEKETINNNKIIIEKKEQKKNQKEKQEEIKKKEKEQQEKNELEKEYNENIIKRFIDMEFAHKLLLLRESKRKQLITKEEIIKETLNYYDDFIIGETQSFNFERNKIKTEVTKLYNDITSTICNLEKREFIPLEHINIKLETLTEATLERQAILNNMIEKKHNYRIDDDERSKVVTNKLTNILNNEKKKEKKDEKVLKKEYKTKSSNNKKQH